MKYSNTLDACRIVGILLLLNIRVSLGQLICYFGSLEHAEEVIHNDSLIQETCRTSSLHESEAHNVSGEQMNNFCLSVTYQNSDSNYTCDHDYFCISEGVLQQFHYRDQLLMVFCCHKEQCNMQDKALNIISQSISTSCYVKPGLDIKCGGSHCMNHTSIMLNGTVLQLGFGCANETVLMKNKCQEKSLPEDVVITCLCKGDHCNQPVMNFSTSIISSTTLLPMLLSMTNPFYSLHQAERKWTFVGTLVAVSVLLLLFLTLVVIGVKKFREHRAQHLTYTYTQLTADLAEERDTDDEYMLIG